MLTLGVGEIVGALSEGKIEDKLGKRAGLLFVMLITTIAFVLLFVYNETHTYSPLTFFVTFFWGFQDSALNNYLNCILGFEFESNILPFSVNKFLSSIFIFALLLAEAEVTTKTDYRIYFICLAAFSAFALSLMLVFKYKKTEEEEAGLLGHQ